MKKRITAGILSGLLILTGLSGCGDSAGDTTTASDVATVTVWSGNGHDKAFLNKKVDEFNQTIGKENGVKIEYIVKEGDLAEMIDLAFVSDQAPDLFGCRSLPGFVDKGYLAALEDIQGSEELLQKFDGLLMENRHTYQGKTYMLPRTVNTYGLIYNKDMFKAAGIVDENGEAKPPETFEELRDYAKRLTNPQNQEYGIIFPAKWTGWYGSDVNQTTSASCGYVDGYNPQTGKFDYSAQIKVMEFLMKIKEDKSYVPGAEGLDNDPARARFGQGGVGMKFAGSFDVGVLKDQFPAKIDWGVAPLPVLDKNDIYKQFSSNGGYLTINKSAPEKIGDEKLMTVYSWFHSDELLKESFQQGLDIPYNWDIVKDVEVSDDLQNWKDFAQLLEISTPVPLPVSSDMTGEKNITEIWLNEIWSEEVPFDQIEERIKEYEQKKNDGIEKYKQTHPEYDASPFIIPDWNAKR